MKLILKVLFKCAHTEALCSASDHLPMFSCLSSCSGRIPARGKERSLQTRSEQTLYGFCAVSFLLGPQCTKTRRLGVRQRIFFWELHTNVRVLLQYIRPIVRGDSELGDGFRPFLAIKKINSNRFAYMGLPALM